MRIDCKLCYICSWVDVSIWIERVCVWKCIIEKTEWPNGCVNEWRLADASRWIATRLFVASIGIIYFLVSCAVVRRQQSLSSRLNRTGGNCTGSRPGKLLTQQNSKIFVSLGETRLRESERVRGMRAVNSNKTMKSFKQLYSNNLLKYYWSHMLINERINDRMIYIEKQHGHSPHGVSLMTLNACIY